MKLFSLFLEALILYFALHLSLLSRYVIPIGQELAVRPQISVQTYVYLLAAWLVMVSVRRLTTKYVGNVSILHFLLPAIVLSSVEYLALSGENSSFSRLFFVYFVIFNLIAFVSSGRLETLLVSRKSDLTDLASQIQARLDLLNSLLRKYYVEVIAAFVLGLVWGQHILRMGLTLTSDSIIYLGTALRYATDGVFVRGAWPPLYPWLISVTSSYTTFPADGAALISAICILFFFLIFALLLREFSTNTFINVMLLVLLGTYDEFINLFLNAWSEQPYLLFLILNLYFLVRHWKTSAWLYFIGACIFASLATLSRYIGVTTGGLLMLYAFFVAEPGIRLTNRIKGFLLPAALSFAPFAYLLWLDASPEFGGGVPGLSQIEEGAVFAYSLRVHSPIDVALSTLGAFWNLSLHPYVILGGFLLLLSMAKLEFEKKQEKEQFVYGLLLLVCYLALTIGAYTVVGAYLKTRYLVPLVFLVYLAVGVVFRHSLSRNLLSFPPVVKQLVLPILIYGSLLFTLVSQVIGIENILVDRVRDAHQKPIQQLFSGFNLSPTARELRSFFESASASYDAYSIVIIDGDYDLAAGLFESDLKLGKTFLLKSAPIAFPGATGFRFVQATDLNRTLEFSVNGVEQQLRVIVPTEATLEGLIPELRNDLESASNNRAAFLIINTQWLDLYSAEAFGAELSNLSLIGEATPYKIFQIAPDPGVTSRVYTPVFTLTPCRCLRRF